MSYVEISEKELCDNLENMVSFYKDAEEESWKKLSEHSSRFNACRVRISEIQENTPHIELAARIVDINEKLKRKHLEDHTSRVLDSVTYHMDLLLKIRRTLELIEKRHSIITLFNSIRTDVELVTMKEFMKATGLKGAVVNAFLEQEFVYDLKHLIVAQLNSNEKNLRRIEKHLEKFVSRLEMRLTVDFYE